MLGKTATVGSIPVRWLEHGEGMPVVLIHGLPTSPALWRLVMPQVQGLSLAYEMVGYGASIAAGLGRNLSLARQAEYLLAWLAQLGIERAILVGHGVGGGVAQILAVRHPQCCAGLLLASAVGYGTWPIPSVQVLDLSARLDQLPDALGRQVLGELMQRGHDSAEQAEQALALHWQPYAEQDGVAALTRQVEALDASDTQAIADQLPALEVPARIVWGSADPFQPLSDGERFAHDLNAPLRRIEGGHHFIPEDHPQVLAEEINLLIDELRPPGSLPAAI